MSFKHKQALEYKGELDSRGMTADWTISIITPETDENQLIIGKTEFKNELLVVEM